MEAMDKTSTKRYASLSKSKGLKLNRRAVSQPRPESELMLEQTSELTSTFLRIRKRLMTDLNIDPELTHQKFELDKEEPRTFEEWHISEATRNRADRVRIALTIYYTNIQKNLTTTHMDESGQPKFPGVEGVYNPLQVIRNRKIRKKYKERFEELDVNLVPAPSQVFSRYKHHRLVWQVNLKEHIEDIHWREQHWHELKTHNGELWFPLEKGPSKFHRHHHRHHHHHEIAREEGQGRMHEQLFADFDGSSAFAKEDDGSRSTSMKSDEVSKSNSLVSLLTGNKRLSNSHSNSHSNSYSNSHGHSNKKSKSPVGISSESSKQDLLADIAFKIEPPPESTPTTPSEGKEIRFEHVENRPEELNTQVRTLKQLQASVAVYQHYIDTQHDVLRIKFENIAQLVQAKTTECNENYARLENNIIKEYDQLFQTLFKDSDEHKQFLSQKYERKLDYLLSLADRTIGEINTSVTLDVRRLNERVDKFGHNLGGLTDDMGWSMAYRLLENLIVVCLWVIWVLVSGYRIVKRVALVLIAILRWIFC